MQNWKPLTSLMGTSISARFTMFLLLCTALSMAACTGTSGMIEPAAAQYQVNNIRPSSQVTVSNEGEVANVQVISETGIGSATIGLVSGSWPDSIQMHFHLQGLEGLHFLYNETAVNISVNTQDMILQNVSVDGATAEEIDEASSYWMAVSFEDSEGSAVSSPVPGGVIIVEAPAAFFTGEYPEFTINWVDFYR